MIQLGNSDLEVFPLCLGGNVFGWTADESESRTVLDAYVEAGGNFVDTADTYSNWVADNPPAISETIIGRWMADRGNRDRMVVTTKIGYDDGLAPDTVRAATERSLERLQVDRIDLLYAHKDDPETPLEDTLAAFDALVEEGLVRWIGASNYTAERLTQALAVSEREGLASFVALQPHYNLVERDLFEGELDRVCLDAGLAAIPYFGLAHGFLTGKYRAAGAGGDSVRAARALVHDHERGRRTLAALEAVADAHGATMAATALAWLRAQPAVTAPIASARTAEQLADLLSMTTLELAANDLARLDAASAGAPA